MALNVVFIAFFLIAFAVALVRSIFFGEIGIWKAITESTFQMAETGFEISLGLTGVMTLWLGIMKIGEHGGVIDRFAKALSPFFQQLFPSLPKGHPAYGHIVMNFSANMLGLDNAATPIGLKAMKSMQEINTSEEDASNAQIMFLVLNTSGLTLLPISVIVYRAEMGAADPSDVFIPILLATFFSTLAGLIAVSFFQKINLLHKSVVLFLGTLSLLITGVIVYFLSLPEDQVEVVSSIAANSILFAIITLFISFGLAKKINVYDAFIEGAKEGFSTAVMIIPYLIAILVAIGVFRASGAMEILLEGVAGLINFAGLSAEFVPALPTALMKPLSGSGARGLMVDAMQTYGPDSFVGRMACCFQGSTDTTFYVLAVYFGSVGIKNTRHALTCGLIADLAGVIAAIFMTYLFFG